MSRAGRLLLAEGIVTQTQLEEAARQQSINGGTIGLHLVRAGVVREHTLTSIFRLQLNLEEIQTEDLQKISQDLISYIPIEIAVTCRVLPVEAFGSDWLCIAMADPTDDRAITAVSRTTGLRLLIKVAAESDVSLCLERLYGTSRPQDLPDWNARKSKTSRVSQAARTQGGSLGGSQGLTDSEGSPSTSRRFRAPVVLEGKYDKIQPDELPPDADAGYIPLTQVKKRPPGSKPVIQVKTVAIEEEKKPEADESKKDSYLPPTPGQIDPSPPPRSKYQPNGGGIKQPDLSKKPTLLGALPTHLKRTSSVPPTPPVQGSQSPPPQPYDPSASPPPNYPGTPLPGYPKTPAPDYSRTPPPELTKTPLPDYSRTPAPEYPKTPAPTDSASPPPAAASPPPTASRPSYGGVPGGESWELDDEKESVSQTDQFVRISNEALSRRDTLLDLPKVDTGQWISESTESAFKFYIAGIRQAESRDEAIQAALSYIASQCRRAAFFVLKRGVIEGFDALGPYLSLEQVRSIWIPLSSRSTLCKTVSRRTLYVGPIGDSRSDAIFCASLGGRKGDSVIVPITLGNRVVSLLYGDDFRNKPPPINQLEEISRTLSQILGALLVKDKNR